MGGLPPALGLELVAEVAGEPAVELEGEIGGVATANGRAQVLELALEVVEDRLGPNLGLPPPSTVTSPASTS